MDELFKQNLLKLRQPPKPSTFSEALFGDVNWARKITLKKVRPAEASGQFSEKGQVLESLERFAQEKFEENESTTLKIPGGEINFKADPVWDGIVLAKSYEELTKSLSIEAKSLEICLQSKIPGKVRIMFVPESFRSFEEFSAELKDGFLGQLIPAFPLKTAELFSRMLAAMKLEDQEVVIYPTMMKDHDIADEVMKVAGYYRPEIIVTLGANPTHKILRGQERLTLVHGQFFNRKIENIGTFIVVPLFHPSIIENNQNMKKTAWSDMQLIMRHLKKL